MPEASNDFYIVIHVWTTCDEHGVCVSKDSAEVIEIAWILIDQKTLEEVVTFCLEEARLRDFYIWKIC